jgi:hypothetical protein
MGDLGAALSAIASLSCINTSCGTSCTPGAIVDGGPAEVDARPAEVDAAPSEVDAGSAQDDGEAGSD